VTLEKKYGSTLHKKRFTNVGRFFLYKQKTLPQLWTICGTLAFSIVKRLNCVMLNTKTYMYETGTALQCRPCISQIFSLLTKSLTQCDIIVVK